MKMKELDKLKDIDEFLDKLEKGEGTVNPTKDKSIVFSSFIVENPEIPSSADDFVSLVDEESSLINIRNLKRSELEEILQSLDPAVKQLLQTKSIESLRFRGTRKINFSLIHGDEDGVDIIAISGRDIENEEDVGSYCHDFEIEGITSHDWEKLKSLFLR